MLLDFPWSTTRNVGVARFKVFLHFRMSIVQAKPFKVLLLSCGISSISVDLMPHVLLQQTESPLLESSLTS